MPLSVNCIVLYLAAEVGILLRDPKSILEKMNFATARTMYSSDIEWQAKNEDPLRLSESLLTPLSFCSFPLEAFCIFRGDLTGFTHLASNKVFICKAGHVMWINYISPLQNWLNEECYVLWIPVSDEVNNKIDYFSYLAQWRLSTQKLLVRPKPSKNWFYTCSMDKNQENENSGDWNKYWEPVIYLLWQ